jgi:acetylornithine deacetylase/succinyl-diaminopimelate desuccinylase-like protein
MGHTDVVGVQPDKWYADPFSGIREDGYIYGRGTLDDKDNVAAGMMVMILLKRLGVELDRDVIFLAESGEEGTPDVGINFMVEKHWDVIDAEFSIAEGGQGVIRDGRVHTFGIETTEKMPRARQRGDDSCQCSCKGVSLADRNAAQRNDGDLLPPPCCNIAVG